MQYLRYRRLSKRVSTLATVFVGALAELINLHRGPAALAALTAFLLYYPTQMSEYYRASLEVAYRGQATPFPNTFIIFFSLLILFGLCLFADCQHIYSRRKARARFITNADRYCALLFATYQPLSGRRRGSTSPSHPALTGLQYLLCFSPLFAWLFALLRLGDVDQFFALNFNTPGSLSPSASLETYQIGGFVYPFVSLMLAAFFLLTPIFLSSLALQPPGEVLINAILRVAIPGLAFLCYEDIISKGLSFDAGLVAVLICIFASGIAALLRIFRLQKGYSIAPLLLLLWMVFVFFGTLSDGRVPIVTEASNPTHRPSSAEAFEGWLKSRPNYADTISKNQRYPVFLVAAEGGGIYAGLQSAAFLAAITDACPKFQDHLFAISGVSGGAVGGGHYAALLKDFNDPKSRDCTKEHIQGSRLNAVRDFFSFDFLSPIAQHWVRRDILAGIVPGFARDFDRGHSLSKSIEVAHRRAIGKRDNKILQETFATYTAGKHAVPALLFNTTSGQSGRRAVISTIKYNEQSGTGIDLLNRLKPSDSITLSTAMSMSARYPWVTPVALVPGIAPPISVGDGGYFDNSGVETLLDLFDEIEPVGQRLGASFHFIISTSATSLYGTDQQLGVLDHLRPLEILSRTRAARSALAISRLKNRVCPACDPLRSSNTINFAASDDINVDYPLGWWISKLTVDHIENGFASAGECRTYDGPGSWNDVITSINSSNRSVQWTDGFNIRSQWVADGGSRFDQLLRHGEGGDDLRNELPAFIANFIRKASPQAQDQAFMKYLDIISIWFSKRSRVALLLTKGGLQRLCSASM